MLNAGRNLVFKLWLLAKITSYKLKLRPFSPLQILFAEKIHIGYPLVPITSRLAARNRFELHLPDCDMTGH